MCLVVAIAFPEYLVTGQEWSDLTGEGKGCRRLHRPLYRRQVPTPSSLQSSFKSSLFFFIFSS
jgi:hypothetical protein